MIITLEEVKNYLRLDDYTEDDVLLQLMIDNAEIYINNFVTIDETNVNMIKQAKLLVLVIVSDMYENRQLIADKVSEKVRYSVQSIINQLSYCYPTEETVV